MAPPQSQDLSSVSWQGRVLPLTPDSLAREGPESWLSPELAPPEKLLPSLQTVVPRLCPSAEGTCPIVVHRDLRTYGPLSEGAWA